MDKSLQFYTIPYNILECLPTNIRDNLRINFAIGVENSKYNCFTPLDYIEWEVTGSTATFNFDSYTTIIKFINFDFTFKGRFQLIEFSNKGSYSVLISINCVAF